MAAGRVRGRAPAASHRRASARLLAWFDAHRRPLPWRRDRDPYHLWVAEVLLQQTRVAQAAPYFERFITRFPTVRSLARASEQEVLKLWEGAGYYGRARRLHAAARLIDRDHDGRLPPSRVELLRLPGVGPYIAAAIASLAFNEPVVALEANGLRVAARLRLDRGDIRRPAVRRRLERELTRFLARDRPGAFNEAIMELGETVCHPRAPDCPKCPLRWTCRAFQELDDPAAVPSPHSIRRRPTVVAALVIVERRSRWLVRRRPPRGLLGGLWEFPGGKPGPNESLPEAARRELREETGLQLRRLTASGVVRHAYSHFSVELHLFRASAEGRIRPETVDAPLRWVTPREFERLPRPAATIQAARMLAGTAAASRDSRSRRDRTPV